MANNSYNYCQLSAKSICEWIEVYYNLAKPFTCKYYVLGLHDNYLVETDSKKYILRVYRNSWRSLEEINFELELLAFLNDKNARVASPVKTRNGELLFFITYPEGPRFAALFPYADGSAPGKHIVPDQSKRLGQAVANIHNSTKTFQTTFSRPVLELPYLLIESLIAIKDFVDPQTQEYLANLQHKIQQKPTDIAKNLDSYGICIGDVNPTNFHIDHRQQVTLFDFDQCGYGYRSFELGKFKSAIRIANIDTRNVGAFLEGYQQVRPLTQQELDAIDYYEIVALIWVMAIHAYNADRIGHKWLEKPFWDRYINLLKNCENTVFSR